MDSKEMEAHTAHRGLSSIGNTLLKQGISLILLVQTDTMHALIYVYVIMKNNN